MLASIRGMSGHDSGLDNESSGSATTSSGDGDESDERSPEIIRSLLMQGAAINAQTDRTGTCFLVVMICQILHSIVINPYQCLLTTVEPCFKVSLKSHLYCLICSI